MRSCATSGRTMANDLIESLSAGDIQPYNPGQPLAPMSHDSWAHTDVDLLREDHSYQSNQLTLFGEALPPGTTEADVQRTLREINSVFRSDFQKLGFPDDLVYPTAKWFMSYATKPPHQVQKHHDFKLPKMFMDDWLADAYCNFLHTLNGTQQQKQQMLNACLQWLAKLNTKVNSGVQPVGGHTPAPRMAHINSDPTENLTDRQYQQLEQHNNAVQAQTMATLERKWGACYKSNIELAQAQLAKMTPAEIAHLDRYTGAWPWTAMLNTVECITFLFDSAIGAASIPKNGADLAKEIQAFESMLKVPSERAKYMRDAQMQGRLRQLYSLRDGG